MTGPTQCPHSDLHFHMNHHSSGDTNLHYLEITAKCKICGVNMLFRGMPMGCLPDRPTTSPGGEEARLPMLGDGDELTGKPIGYAIRVSTGDGE